MSIQGSANPTLIEGRSTLLDPGDARGFHEVHDGRLDRETTVLAVSVPYRGCIESPSVGAFASAGDVSPWPAAATSDSSRSSTRRQARWPCPAPPLQQASETAPVVSLPSNHPVAETI